MRKVKQGAGVTGARYKRKPAAARAVARNVARSKRPSAPVRSGRDARASTADSTFVIKALDPVSKCGAGTSVQFLYRVDELVAQGRRAHLVFFDHHGWYCEHGRTCPAVAPARTHAGQVTRGR